MSGAKPIHSFERLSGNRKPLNLTNLPTVHVPVSVGVVVAIRQDTGMTNMTLKDAEAGGFIKVFQICDNHFGVLSDLSIQILSSRVHLAVFPKV